MAARHGGEQRTAHATNGANRDAAAGDATISPRSGGCCRQKVMLEETKILVKAVRILLMVIVVLGHKY